MGCISCKTVFPNPTKNKKLAGKARLPGISKKEKEKVLLERKKLLEQLNIVDIDQEKVRILQQLEEESIDAKKASGGVAYVFGDEGQEEKDKPKRPPQKLMERLERPTTSQGFNTEEKEIMVECLKNETLKEKGRSARLYEERRFIAEMNRENALKLKARMLEKKLREREEKQHAAKMKKEQETFDASVRNAEKQQKAKQRRQTAGGEQTVYNNEGKETSSASQNDVKEISKMPVKETSKIDIKEVTKIDVQESSKVDVKVTSKNDVKETSKIDVKETSKIDVKEISKIDVKEISKIDVKVTSRNYVQESSKVDVKVTSKNDVKETSKIDVKETSKIDVKEISKIDVKEISKIDVKVTSRNYVQESSKVDVKVTSKNDVKETNKTDGSTSKIAVKETSLKFDYRCDNGLPEVN